MLNMLAGLFFLAAFVPYIRSILKGETKPAKVSWLIWATLDTIMLATLVAKHAVNGQIIGAVMGAWIVVYLAFRYGQPGFKKLDLICLFGAVVGLMLWAITKNPVITLAISVVILLVGAIPTVVNAWKAPRQENRLAWTLYWLSCVFAMLAITDWTFVNAGQQTAFTIIETTMVAIVWLKG